MEKTLSKSERTKLLNTFVAKGLPGWQKIAQSLYSPIQVICNYTTSGFVGWQVQDMEPTETLVVDSPDFPFKGPLWFDQVEAFKDQVVQKIKETVTPCWRTQALANPVEGTPDTVTAILLELNRNLNVRMWASVAMCGKLTRDKTLGMPDSLILFSGPENFWQGMTYRLQALTCLNGFNGVVIAEPIPTAFDLKLEAVQNDPDTVHLRATLKWRMPPTKKVLHCIQFSD